MNRLWYVGLLVVILLTGHIFAQGMGRGMMGRGRMNRMQPLMAWMNGAELDGQPSSAMPADLSMLRGEGRLVYKARCVPCHGANGDGKGPEAHRLGVPPTDFTRGTFKFRSTVSGKAPTHEDVFRTVSRGVHGTAMLPWVAWLSERELWAVSSYVRDVLAALPEAEDAIITIPPAPEILSKLAAQGKELYAELKCVDCHGQTGRGDGPRSEELKDLADRPISPRDFTQGRLKAGSRPSDLYRTIATGLDGTPMASFDIGPEYLWPLVAYVKSLIPESKTNNSRWMGRGMMGMMRMGAMHPEEHLGMMIDMPGMQGMQGRAMMGR